MAGTSTGAKKGWATRKGGGGISVSRKSGSKVTRIRENGKLVGVRVRGVTMTKASIGRVVQVGQRIQRYDQR